MPLIIDIEDTEWRACDTVSGTVLLKDNEDVDIQLLSIRLIGFCEIMISGNARESLIDEAQILFEGPRTVHPGLSWPFEFTLPPHCVTQRQEQLSRQPSGGFNQDPWQRLPPSFSDMSSQAGVRIVYALQASLKSRKSFSWGSADMKVERVLNLVTTRDVEAPDPRLLPKTKRITCQSIRLRPGRENTPPTFKERLQSIRPTNFPIAIFKLKILLPTVGVAEQSLPITLRLNYNSKASTSPSPPTVLLRACKLELLATTQISHPREGLGSWTKPHTISSANFPEGLGTRSDAPEVIGHMDIRQLMMTRIPSHHVPTFATFNIRRVYSLRVTVTVECAHKTFTPEFNTDFELLAADYGPAVGDTVVHESSSAALEMGDAPDYEEESGARPPSYEDVARRRPESLLPQRPPE